MIMAMPKFSFNATAKAKGQFLRIKYDKEKAEAGKAEKYGPCFFFIVTHMPNEQMY